MLQADMQRLQQRQQLQPACRIQFYHAS
jgi:hypothetical protein